MIQKKQQAFMKAYEACHEAFLRYCSAISFGKMDTEDLVQDVLYSAFRNFDKLRDKDHLLHYLIKAARNRSISNLRVRSRQVELTESHANRLAAKGVDSATLVDIQLLYSTLQSLPEKQSTALILFEINGFSMK
ncbi:MAG: sigma-70 family RNA polymerase sigma factor, partial [Bacteroidota bacterium]